MKITVFTPTYNRAYILQNLYRSLRSQKYRDFEWLIVDDGSKDNTKQLIDKWIKENNFFPIRYYYQENSGKHVAINMALDKAKGDLFFTVDSDDYLTADALYKISKWEVSLPRDGRFCGVAGNLGTSINYTQNPSFNGSYIDKSLLDRYTYQENGKNVLSGERAYIFYTKIHREYKYPIFQGEKFMTEAVVWNRMAANGYLMRFYNDIIWIYEYREDGLTQKGNKLFLDNPRGYGLWLSEKLRYQKGTFFDRIKLYYTFTCELSKQYDDVVLIAESIGAPRFLIKVIISIRKLMKRR